MRATPFFIFIFSFWSEGRTSRLQIFNYKVYCGRQCFFSIYFCVQTYSVIIIILPFLNTRTTYLIIVALGSVALNVTIFFLGGDFSLRLFPHFYSHTVYNVGIIFELHCTNTGNITFV